MMRAEVVRADQKTLTFILQDGLWRSSPDINSTLESLTDARGNLTGWRYTTGSDDVETYDAAGKLLSIATRAGLTQSLGYNAQGRLKSVTDDFGRALTFDYGDGDRIRSITDPAGGTYSYEYDGNDNLEFVTGPDGETRRYLYEHIAFRHALTGLIDENDVRFATFDYDSEGRARTSERAGGVDKVSVNYDFVNGITSVTDALGTTRVYTYAPMFGVARTSQAIKPSISDGAVTGTAISFWSYDQNGNVATYIDYRGSRTDFTYDLARNLEISRTEAAGTPLERTITTEWHPEFRLPTKITEPNRVIDFAYDSNGRLERHTVTAGSESRTWTFQYRADSQIKQIDGPRTDVDDITRYAYDDQGRLKSRTNPLGHKTEITAYDAHGRPLTIVDPNGLVTALEYDARGRLLSHHIGGELTTYEYDAVGQLVQLTRSDGRSFGFTYDGAHRLIAITDNLGNAITYTLDAVGNPIQEQLHDPEMMLTRTRSRAFDALSRLARSLGAQGQTTSYAYDDNDNLVQMTDPFGHSALWSYDQLDRLVTSTDLNGARTGYSYDDNDQLTMVTDTLLLRTIYGYDGLGNQTSTSSPDTGLTQYIPDDAGNTKSREDARRQATTYSYDALDRVTDVEFSGGTVTFIYDQETDDAGQETNGIGRLTQMIDGTGTTHWTYDQQGRVTRKTQQVANRTFVTQYRYDASGRLTSIIYPSRQVLELGYTDGQVTQISVNGSTLLRDIEYEPFGPPRAWTWGDGTSYRRAFDLDGQVVGYDLGEGRRRELIYDVAGRIDEYFDTDPSRDESFGYDAAGALTEFGSNVDLTTLSLDANGNRTSLSSAQRADVYTYSTSSNRLLGIAGTHSRTYQYDAAGNVTSDGIHAFEYDGRGRLIRVTRAQGTTHYQINGLGQRVAKLGDRGRTYFVYDEAGRLLGEYNFRGRPIQETVYLDDTPVTVLARGRFFVYADHLSTPRAIADRSGKIVWRWDGDPFGATPPNEDPDRDGRRFTYNPRFPGQYFDQETGLSYNYFRDYDPQTGRYIQADPLGLEGGNNPYSYVEGNPLSYFDPYGLVDLDGSANSAERIPTQGRNMSSIDDISTPAYPYGVPAGRIPVAERIDPGRAPLLGVNLYGQSPQNGQRVFYLAPDALAAFRGLRSAAMAAGFEQNLFTLASAHRPQARQDFLRARAETRHGNNAGRWVARRSEHITGRTFDLWLGINNDSRFARLGTFENLPAYQWLKHNARYFGLSPYEVEPWHWTYNPR